MPKLVDTHKNTESRIRLEIKTFLGFKELDFKTDTKVIVHPKVKTNFYIF